VLLNLSCIVKAYIVRLRHPQQPQRGAGAMPVLTFDYHPLPIESGHSCRTRQLKQAVKSWLEEATLAV
jgi:hypothetical protein